jgi:hypothetical protein
VDAVQPTDGEDADPDAPWLRDPGDADAAAAPEAHDVTQQVPAGDVTQHAPADDVTQHAPVDDVTQQAPAADVTQHAPVDDVTQQAPAADVTQHAPVDDVTQDAPADAVAPHDVTQSVTQSSPSSPASADASYVSMDPVAVSHCACCLRDGAEELRDVSRTVAPVGEAHGLPEDVRSTLITALTTLRTLLEALAGELTEHGDELDSRANVAQDDDPTQAPGSLTSVARGLFGSDAWTVSSAPQDDGGGWQGMTAISAASGPGVVDADQHGALIDAAWGPGVADSSAPVVSHGALIDAASGPGVTYTTPVVSHGALIDAASGGGVTYSAPAATGGQLIDAASGSGITPLSGGGATFSFGGGLPSGGSFGAEPVGTVANIGGGNPFAGTPYLLPGLDGGAAYGNPGVGLGGSSMDIWGRLVVNDFVGINALANVSALTPG